MYMQMFYIKYIVIFSYNFWPYADSSRTNEYEWVPQWVPVSSLTEREHLQLLAPMLASINYTTTLKTKTNINCKQYPNIDTRKHTHIHIEYTICTYIFNTETQLDVAGQMSSFFVGLWWRDYFLVKPTISHYMVGGGRRASKW